MKNLLFGLLFLIGCSDNFIDRDRKRSENSRLPENIIENNKKNIPKKVSEVEGKDLYLLEIEPNGKYGCTHYLYFFKDGPIETVVFPSGKSFVTIGIID